MREDNDLIIVANRLPVRRSRKHGGEEWDTSPGGLVSALLPILRREGEAGHGGAWVGWSGSRSRTFSPFEHEGVCNAPINLSKEKIAGYYDGMSNGTLWPLYHDVVRPPTFKRAWWQRYKEVNDSFARAAAALAAPNATVWVHDYHLHLVPSMLRQARPDLRIGFFLHIPFPDRRLFAQLPWRRQLIEGTLGADVIGFQTKDDAGNFIDAAQRHAHADPHDCGVTFDGRSVCADAFPISIDARQIEAVARSSAVAAHAERHERRLGGRKIFIGVDRMDYTKGIPHRLRAFQELLRSGRATPDEVVLVQSCVPTRESVDAYADLRSEVEQLVGHINGEFGSVGRGCVHYLRQNLAMDQLVALYRAAHVALVTPVRDGMNLVAKEYVACQFDNRGALVLSENTGSAFELSDALIVNPHDLDGMVAAMEQALRMDRGEAQRRMRAMRETVLAHDVYAWADAFLKALRGEGDVAPEARRQPEPVTVIATAKPGDTTSDESEQRGRRARIGEDRLDLVRQTERPTSAAPTSKSDPRWRA